MLAKKTVFKPAINCVFIKLVLTVHNPFNSVKPLGKKKCYPSIDLVIAPIASLSTCRLISSEVPRFTRLMETRP